MNRFLLALLWLGLAGSAAAQWSNKADELLEPEKAFRFSARVLDGAVEVRFAIAEGYYLYRDKFRFSAEGNPSVAFGTAELPRGARHRDEFFGDRSRSRRRTRPCGARRAASRQCQRPPTGCPRR